MAQSVEGESQCSASGRTVWVVAGKEQKGTGLPHGQLCCLAQVRIQVHPLQWTLSILQVLQHY